jgi:glutamine---fructose-6-phosphate transaminase (isomerizing)
VSVGYLDGVRGQPDNLRRSAVVLRAALAGPVGSGAVAALRRGALVALGMGASTHAAAGFAAVLRATGRPALGMSAADLGDGVPPGLAAAFLGVSQSGRSRETVSAFAAVPAGTAVRVALTNDPATPLAAIADAVLPLGSAEDTRVSTLSYTATLQALGLLADRLTGRASADWAALPDLAAAVLDTDVEPLAAALADAGCVDVVASGVRAATAGAVGMLLREAAHLPAASFATREYLHGPLETAGPGQAALIFGAGREVSLAADLAGYGANVVLFTDAGGDLPAHPRLHVVRLPRAGGLAGCVLDILPVQLAAHTLAERSGRPIELRHMPADTKLDGAAG